MSERDGEKWQRLKKQLLNCPAYDLIGLKAEEEGDRLVAVLEVGEQHLNYAGIAKGIFPYALGDAVMRWEVSRLIPDKKSVTGTAEIVFKKAASKGDILKAEGKIIRQEGRKFFTEATVFNQKQEIVATLEGIFILLKEEF